MISTNGMTTLAFRSKNLVTDQTWNDVTTLLNTAGVAFDVTNGLGQAANTSSIVALHVGGFDAQKVTGVINFPSPTTAGTEDLGLFLGALTFKTGIENYLYARVNAGSAKIVSVVAGVFTTLASTPWAVAQGVNMTIVFSRVGLLLSASFTAASGPAPVNLSFTLASNSTLISGGLMGFRSLTHAVWCRSITGEQVQ